MKIGLYVKVKRKDEEGVAEEKDDRTIVKASKMEKLMKLTRTVESDEYVEVDEFKRQSKDKQKYLKQRVIVSGEWFEHSCLSRKKDGHESRAKTSKRRNDICDRGGGREGQIGRSGDGGVQTSSIGDVRVDELK